MFEFTTETLVNSLNEKNFFKKEDDTLIRVENIILPKDGIVSISKKTPTDGQLAKVSFNMTDLVISQSATVNEEIYRIALYIQLSMASQDSFYANDLLYKGKPIYIEFKVKKSDSAADIARRVVTIAKNYMLVQAQEKILNVTADGAVVTITGVNGYQQFTKAILQKYDEKAKTFDCCNDLGDFVNVVEGVPAAYQIVNGAVELLTNADNKNYTIDNAGNQIPLADNQVPIFPGLEAFGDYNWIMHNLRLPTLANTNFWSTTKTELPSVGEKYTQYVFILKKTARGIAGEAVGMETTSVTTHVLYVASGAVTALNTAIAAVFTNITVDTSAQNTTPYAVNN